MIEDGTSIPRDIKIGIAVIVEVADGNTLAVVSFTADAGFFRYIGESSIAVVVIKRAANRMWRLVDIGGGGLNEVQIHQAILIVIDPRHAGSHSFEIILFFRLRGVLLESNLRALANVGVTHGNSRFRRLRMSSSGCSGVRCCAIATPRLRLYTPEGESKPLVHCPGFLAFSASSIAERSLPIRLLVEFVSICIPHSHKLRSAINKRELKHLLAGDQGD